MSVFRAAWSRLDGLQRTVATKVVLAVLALAAVAAVGGTMWSQATEARARFMSVVEVLQEINSLEKDAVTIQLLEEGQVEVDGTVYGDERFTEYAASLFDEESGQLIDVALLAALLVAKDVPEWIPPMLIDSPGTILWVSFAVLAWLLLVIFSEITLQVSTGILATAVACGFVGLAWLLGFTSDPKQWVLAFAGIGLLVITFLLLIRVVLAVLGQLASPAPRLGKHGVRSSLVQIFAVAHVLIRESIRLRISLAFIVVLLVALPLIPLWIDSSEPLRYQVQNFLSDSMSLVYILAACMTLILGCATVSFEIRDRQIWQLMTKPIGRIQYLLGKWLGLLILNFVLILIGGLSIFSFTEYLRTRPTADPLDAVAVNDEVLTARVGVRPIFTSLTTEEVRQRVDSEIDNNAVLKDEIATGEKRMNDVRRQLARQTRREHLDQQRAISPATLGEGGELDTRVYVFPGLESARRDRTNITLRYEFHIGRSESTDHYPVVFEFPDVGQRVEQIYVPEQWHSLLIPSDWIGEDGLLRLRILNGGFSQTPSDATLMFFPNGATLYFDADGLEIMWQASSFESNFLRAMIINWVKLAFLGILGVAAATFLSFPVAVMLAFTIFIGGSLAPFIAMSVDEFRVDPETVWPVRLVQWAVIGVAWSAEWLLRPFGEASPNVLVVEGRLVPWIGVLRNLLQIGVFWSGFALLIGWWAFRRRELAIYSGNG